MDGAGLNRSGSSCRLRWVNYLCPHLKRTDFTPEEERMIIELHARWGNRWSRIAQCLPGRTDNAIKNFFRTRIKKKNHLLERCNCNIQHGMHEKCKCLIRSSSPPTSFRKHYFLEDNGTKSYTSLPRQSTEDCQVTYINDIKKENPDTWNVVEGHSTDFPFSFSVLSLNSITLPELYGEGKQSCSLYNTASPTSFANTELNSYELWNIDEG
ncbi:hypothetical protein KI387_042493 [Taxus chinensis]|uniref:MYB transcription factor n=1 Tax=Taxus chinensis TaxID=29808 RepID=A0AA38F8I7_TAXCH|nr:hypothetical protein KI387_042493 [Taxus chinensis]